MIEELVTVFRQILEQIVGIDRLRMQHAMRYWCSVGGCITSRASNEPPFSNRGV